MQPWIWANHAPAGPGAAYGRTGIMNSAQLQYFLAAAKFENFTKAAETLYISQPVLGRQISNLEKELGFPLFERNRKTVRLTKYGRVFEEFARDTVERYAAMARFIQEELRQDSMSLKIGSVDGQLVEHYFGPALKRAVDYYPNLSISVSYYPNSVKMFDAMNLGEIDAAIAGLVSISKLQTPVQYKQIGVMRCCFAVPVTLPLAQIEDPSDADFQNVRFILRSEEDSRTSRGLQLEIAKRYGITNFVEVPNIATLTALVRSGVGVTVVMDNDELCFDPGIRKIYIPNGHSFEEYLIWRKDNANPAIGEFCKVLDETKNPT